MEKYVAQLVKDIEHATENVVWPYREKGRDICDWISDEKEERTAPRRQLEEWTRIRKVELPPVDRLTDDQVERLLVDPKYDDEHGNPHDYGFGRDHEDDKADWWKKE